MSYITETNGKNEDYLKRTNDKIYTPLKISKMIIDSLPIKEEDTLYDPFYGNGSFYEQFPKQNKLYFSEIDLGKDFFEFETKVDWIISNPPYSIFDDVLKHSFEIAENVVYLIPANKIFASMNRIRQTLNYGNIKEMRLISASKCGFPFGFPCVSIWIKKNYKGSTEIKLMENKDTNENISLFSLF